MANKKKKEEEKIKCLYIFGDIITYSMEYKYIYIPWSIYINILHYMYMYITE